MQIYFNNSNVKADENNTQQETLPYAYKTQK